MRQLAVLLNLFLLRVLYLDTDRSLRLSTSRTTFVIKNFNVGKNIKITAVKIRIHQFILTESGCKFAIGTKHGIVTPEKYSR